MKKSFIFWAILLFAVQANCQQTKRVLFLGNSYTGVNNLPQLVADVAQSQGDSLIFDSNTPGGYTLQGHSTNANSLAKIAQGGWDYVVIQEQSQLPSFPWSQFSTASLPFADSLCTKTREADSCAIPLFYMTWGRKNGDQQNCATWPPVCTYAGMQHLLRERYVLMADTNRAQVAPVGAVWRDVRANHANIELYASDGSHPSLEGSYLAACTFYASIFHQSPVGAAIPGFMNTLDAQAIQNQAASTIFDSLGVWMIDTLTPKASFLAMIQASGDSVVFDGTNSTNADSAYWSFGDGNTGSGFVIGHKYQTTGWHNVVLKVWRGCLMDSIVYPIYIGPFDLTENEKNSQILIYPVPAKYELHVQHLTYDLSESTYCVYGLQGQLLLSGKNPDVINVSALPAGVYILQIKNSSRVNRIRFEKL